MRKLVLQLAVLTGAWSGHRVAGAVPGEVVAPAPESARATAPAPDAPVGATTLNPGEVSSAVGAELAKRHVQLSLLGLRSHFARDSSGTWFVELTNLRDASRATLALGNFDTLSDERIRALATQVSSLIASSWQIETSGPVVESTPAHAELAGWVRPAALTYAAASATVLVALATSESPNFSMSYADAPSALLSTGMFVGIAGGGTALFAPEQAARPLLELTVTTSTALQALGAALSREPGLSPVGEYAVASGYALTSALLAADWALSPPAAMLEAPAGSTRRESPTRAISPWIVYAPSVLGAVVSLSRSFTPGASDNRGLSLALGTYALVPSTLGLVLGVTSAHREPESEPKDSWIAGGPSGSYGLTIGGSL